MRNISCDICGKDLSEAGHGRYVVRMEGFATAEPVGLADDDVDCDHVEAMSELLEAMQVSDDDKPAAHGPGRLVREFDLCPCCYRKFAADPLGRESGRKLHFSPN